MGENFMDNQGYGGTASNMRGSVASWMDFCSSYATFSSEDTTKEHCPSPHGIFGGTADEICR